MRYRITAPTDPLGKFADRLRVLERQIAELQRPHRGVVHSWSNPITGITGGSPSWSGWYTTYGELCTFAGTLTLGGTPSVFAPVLSLPVAAAEQIKHGQFDVTLTDSGVANYAGDHERGSTLSLLVVTAGGTYGQFSGLSTTIPFTWGSGDFFDVSGTYRIA